MIKYNLLCLFYFFSGVQRFIINIAAVVGPLVAGALLQNVVAMMCGMLAIVIVATILVRGVVYRALKPV